LSLPPPKTEESDLRKLVRSAAGITTDSENNKPPPTPQVAPLIAPSKTVAPPVVAPPSVAPQAPPIALSGGPPPPPPPPISSTLIESLQQTDPLANLKRELAAKPEGGTKRSQQLNQDVVESLKMMTPSSTGDNLRPSDVFKMIGSRSRTDLNDDYPTVVATRKRSPDAKKLAETATGVVSPPPANARSWLYEPQRKPIDNNEAQSKPTKKVFNIKK
jgi:hypothetical protein